MDLDRIIFGEADPYLNKGVAKKFHELFPASDLFLLPGAMHFVQMDEPEKVADLILFSPGDKRDWGIEPGQKNFL